MEIERLEPLELIFFSTGNRLSHFSGNLDTLEKTARLSQSEVNMPLTAFVLPLHFA
jgi:hypothetical protein